MKTILVDAINTFVLKNEGIFKEMHELLEMFPNRKIILTNANDEEIEKFLPNMPYEIFTMRHNPDKPNPEYYKAMLAKFGFNPEDVVYFEHNPEAVKSAESVGIKTYHYNRDEKNMEMLKDFLLKSL